MRIRLITAALALVLFSAQAQALTLNEARQQGRVGETLNGYLEPLRQDKETLELVKQINAARSDSYQQQIAEAIYNGLRKYFDAHPLQSAPQGGAAQTASAALPGEMTATN